MAVAPLPINPKPSSRSRRTSRRPLPSRPRNQYQRSPKMVEQRTMRKPKVEEIAPRVAKLPPQLKFFLKLQQGTNLIAFSLIAVTLGIYAWTVYVPTLWSKEYRNLVNLQRHERDLIGANEGLKNQLAKQAENPAMGLAAPHPAQAIFLKEPKNQPFSKAQNPSNSEPEPFQLQTPPAY